MLGLYALHFCILPNVFTDSTISISEYLKVFKLNQFVMIVNYNAMYIQLLCLGHRNFNN